MNLIEFILEDASGVRGPRANGEGAIALSDVLGESDLVDLEEVLIMDTRQTDPVCC